ncbi:RNA-binding protein 5-like isoform X2 [Physella acuta]|uniref:RNA-binding protein 5-like isoform X2 n=1 Tax=Physella acuta TaxID=109671 RepID=UPI0027DB6399|nr:RNA-binding protein 5-like isoform X2 [Physella acuta]
MAFFHGNPLFTVGPNFQNERINIVPGSFNNYVPGFDDPNRSYGIDPNFHNVDLLNRVDPMPPGIDNAYQSRDRGRERDREQRDIRSRDDRDRGRDRDRRRNDHDRDRGRSDWSQDRDNGRSGRHRDRSGNRDRSPMSDDGDRSGSSDRFRNRDSDPRDLSRSSEDKGGDKWVCAQPSRTIILRGLHFDIDEKLIGAELMMLGLPVKDIRLIRRSSGVSRGFAFVEFHNVADAQRWMEHTQGNLVLLNQYRAVMAYSVTRDRGGNRDGNLQRNDWVCIKCLSHNFKRRDFCYNCNLSRKESEKGKSSDGQDEIGINPCNTLIFRGLDALTTEEGLVTALTQAFAPTPLAPIKNVSIIRDDLGTSRGFGFIEFHSVAASTVVLDSLNKLDPPLEVDGKQLIINYAKNTYNTTMAYIQQSHLQLYGQGTSSASSSSTASSSKNENTTNTAAAVAQAAIQQAQAAKHFQKQIQKKILGTTGNETVTVNGIEYPVYPAPDTSSYQYEETSGYYYDPLTQLYYDANSQYYYNSTTGQFMYWDSERSTYLPAPTNEDGNRDEAPDGPNKKDSKEDKKDKEKVKIAKKIAKDMEKWAKSLNAQKEAQKEGFKRTPNAPQQPGSFPSHKQESAAADAGFAMLQKVKEDMSMMPPPPIMKPSSSKPGLVASYGGDSDSGEEDDSTAPLDESKLVDWAKLACLLCKRQFQSKEILSKHTQVSDLHKQNLEALTKSKGSSSGGKVEYRDRAKERRQKYGAPEPPEPRKRKERDFEAPIPVVFDEPTKKGIGDDNIGNKLLQKMGWSQGMGLGKANQGRTDPIEAKRRNQMAGLGARGANVVADVGDNYRDALKKTMYARYNEMD